MAEAGFFHTNRKDLVICFQCGLGLEDWSEQEPWRRHALWNNNCPYVIEKKRRAIHGESKKEF